MGYQKFSQPRTETKYGDSYGLEVHQAEVQFIHGRRRVVTERTPGGHPQVPGLALEGRQMGVRGSDERRWEDKGVRVKHYGLQVGNRGTADGR